MAPKNRYITRPVGRFCSDLSRPLVRRGGVLLGCLLKGRGFDSGRGGRISVETECYRGPCMLKDTCRWPKLPEPSKTVCIVVIP